MERFTQRARHVLSLAKDSAVEMGHAFIGTEHVLIGLLEEGGATGQALSDLGLEVDRVKTLVQRMSRSATRPPSGRVELAPGTKRLLELAVDEMRRQGQNYIGTEHLLLASMRQTEGIVASILRQFGLTPSQVRRHVQKTLKDRPAEGGSDPARTKEKSKTPVVDQLTTDLTTLAAEGKLDPVIGREMEVERVIQILSRRTKNNPALIGEPGVGKTAIVEGLAQRIYRQEAPDPLLNKRLLQLDVGSLVAGTMYRGQFEERLALERRFQPIYIDEPTVGETIEILHGVRRPYEKHHQLTITDEAIEAAARLSARYVTGRFLPDKAIDLIDESSSRVRMYKTPQAQQLRETYANLRAIRADKEAAEEDARETDAAALQSRQEELEATIEQLREAWRSPANRPTVGEEDIAEVVSMWTGIPVARIAGKETERLLGMEKTLQERIIGQDEAIHSIAKAVRRARAGLKDPKRPIGSFMFLGPTGTGKTELTKALAEFMFGSEEALIQLDMSEFMERHTVARMIGSPPGYVGYEDAGQLTESIRRRPYSIVVFDELEKAHPDAFNVLLQIMEEGQLSDAKGRKTDFRNAIIIMTSNVGAEIIKRGASLGFSFHRDQTSEEESAYETMRGKLIDRLKGKFRPEFLNRVDSVVVFRALNRDDIVQIVDLEIAKVNQRLLEQGLCLQLTQAAREMLASKGYDPDYGARPLRRLIQSLVEEPLSDDLLAGRFQAGDVVSLDVREGVLELAVADKETGESLEEPGDVVAETTA
jgi:ATP-dependent Clp protease ATP-binding subunit ClpC